MKNVVPVPLDLPDTRVLEVSRTERGHWLIRVESTRQGTACKRCGREITELHGRDAPIRLRHLPIFDVPVYLEVRPKRYRCRFCAGRETTTERCAWYDPKSPNTRPYEQWLLRMLTNATVADTARKLGITEETVEGVLDRWIAREVDWAHTSPLETVGTREIALRRGHRDYVVLVTTPTPAGVEVLAVLPDRRKETVAAFRAGIPPVLRETIRRICTDMYRGYREAGCRAAHSAAVSAREVVPWAEVVADRFHVAKAYRECADLVRKKEVRRLKKELGPAGYGEIQGAMWPFRRNPAELAEAERARLDRLFARSPKLEQAYRLREAITAIFESRATKAEAARELEAWAARVRESGLKEFESFLGTLERWKEEITNYFLDRQTSAFVEGFNNRVKVLKRRCYGIFDGGRLFQRLTLDLHGYALFRPA